MGETAAAAIASETIFGQRAGEERFAIAIEIGSPFKWTGPSPTEWACEIKIFPWRSKAVVHGEGSLQALTLALRSVQSDLAAFVQDGGKLTFETGEHYPLSSMLPEGWASQHNVRS